jgi:hypothetical protein
MNFEKARQRLTRRIRQVRASAALNLRQVTLADLAARFRLYSLYQFLLIQRPAHTAKATFYLAEIPDLVSKLHTFRS